MITKTRRLTETALFKRVARRLARDGEFLTKTRYDSSWFQETGRYQAHDSNQYATRTHIDLNELALELRVARKDELPNG